MTIFNQAQQAWQQWSFREFHDRAQCLNDLANAMSAAHCMRADVIRFHVEQATSLIATPHDLMGPTGESNVLYTVGRGVILLVHDASGPQAEIGVLAQLTAALIAGNSVILCTDDLEMQTCLQHLVQAQSCPIHTLQLRSLNECKQLLTDNVRGVGYVGDLLNANAFNMEIAKHVEWIVNLVAETDLNSLPVAHDPRLVLRFVSEKTRTINMTAIGGNASLLGQVPVS